MQAAAGLCTFRLRGVWLFFPFRREVPTEVRGQGPSFPSWFYFELHPPLVRIVHNAVPYEALFHCKRLATASMLTHERPLFLVEGENVALQVEHGSVGSPTAFSWTVVHVSLRSMSLHVLLKVVFALERLLAHCTDDFLFMGFPHVLQKLCPCFCHKRTSLLTQIALVNLPVPLQPAG